MRVPPATCVVLALFFVPTSLSQGRASNAWVPSSVGAESLLTPLVGTWHFGMYSADRHDPVTSGQREMRLMSDSTKLAWTETFRGRSDIGTGILGYNKEELRCLAAQPFVCRPTALRLRPLRPQLKRDPLGRGTMRTHHRVGARRRELREGSVPCWSG